MQQTEKKSSPVAAKDSLFVQLPWRRWVHSLLVTAMGTLRVSVWVVGLVAIAVLALGFVSSHKALPVTNSKLAVGSVLSVAPGSTSSDIGRMLEEGDLVRDSRMFSLLSRVLRIDDRLQAGEYLFSPGMSLMELMRRLESGNVVTARVTIREGMNLRQIAETLASRELVDRERFLELAQDEALIYGDSSPIVKPYASLEGYLFPDTYVFVRGQSEEEIIKRMVARFVEVAVPELERRADAGKLSLHELVTLASIIEKEAMVDRERPIISGVFHNRMNIGMPLQSDPTVQYVMAERRAKLYNRDLAIDSPFNTYKHRGLPPGPIASPGKASLIAAAEPADVQYLYFVAKGDGTHVFGRTFAEHVRNRRRVGW